MTGLYEDISKMSDKMNSQEDLLYSLMEDLLKEVKDLNKNIEGIQITLNELKEKFDEG